MWNGNSYGDSTATTATSWPIRITWYSSSYDPPPRRLTKAEQRFEEELEKLKGDTSKLLAQLRAREATKKAASDKASRGRRPHPSTGKDLGRRLQTYDAAMAARQVVRSAP